MARRLSLMSRRALQHRQIAEGVEPWLRTYPSTADPKLREGEAMPAPGPPSKLPAGVLYPFRTRSELQEPFSQRDRDYAVYLERWCALRNVVPPRNIFSSA